MSTTTVLSSITRRGCRTASPASRARERGRRPRRARRRTRPPPCCTCCATPARGPTLSTSRRAVSGEVRFDLDFPETPLVLPIDRRLVTQAVTNLVKNAKEAIEARPQDGSEPPARIAVTVSMSDEAAVVEVADNGIGLPREDRGRLTEPYMTTREKGTGLGLAIVKRIMEEHGGDIELTDAPDSFDGGRGALVRLVFPMGGSLPATDSGAAGDSNGAK